MYTVDKYQHIGFFPNQRAFALLYQTAGMLDTVIRQGVLGEDDIGEESPKNLILPSRRPSLVCENCIYSLDKDIRARAFHIMDPSGVIQMFLIFLEERGGDLLNPPSLTDSEVLKVFPFPVTVTIVQFAVGTVLVMLMWITNLYKRPKITGAQLVAILPLAIVHVLGNLFTNVSLGKVAISLTHTIKASEPFFSVILSALFMGEYPTAWVVASLLPIVCGVGLASMLKHLSIGLDFGVLWLPI